MEYIIELNIINAGEWRIVNMSNDIENKPYLEKPKENVETTKEQLIYGGGETLQEVQEKRKKQQLLNE